MSLSDMRDSKPSVSTPSSNETRPSSSSVDVFELRFAELCKKKLLLDEAIYSSSMKLFRDTKHLLFKHIFRGKKQCALGAHCRLTEGSEERWNPGCGFSLCQILKAAELNMVDFFKELPYFIVLAGPIFSLAYGKSWESRLLAKELQANFGHLSHLSKYYKRAYSELFLIYEAKAGNETDGTNTSNKGSNYQRFGWLLFLALRVHAFSRIKNIVTCMNGHVSIQVNMIVHMPAQFRNFCLSDSSRFGSHILYPRGFLNRDCAIFSVRRSDNGVDLIASLSKIYETSED